MKNKILLLTLVLSVLAGCSNMRDATMAHQYTDDAKESVESHMDQMKSYITTDEKVSIQMAEMPDPLDFLNHPVSLVMNELNFTNLSQILPAILDREVRFANDLQNPIIVDNASSSDTGNFITKPLSLNYQGALSGMLNSICFQLKCSWQVRQDGSIYISKYQTKFWRLALLPSDRTSTTSLSSESRYGGDSSGGGGEGGENISGSTGGSSSVQGDSGQTVTSTFEYKSFDTVKSIIEPLIGDVDADSGKKWSYSPQTGLISVTATNEIIENIDNAINNLSEYLTSQVVFNVKLITYEEKETESYGIDWNILWERIGEIGVSTNIGTNVDANADQIGFTVLESGQPFSGTSAFINTLSEFATITSTNDLNYFTLSNQVLPINIAEEIPFNITEQVFVPDVAVGTSTTLFTKSVGLHMNLLPVILNENELLMEFKYSLSSLSSFVEIDLGTNGSARIPQTKVNEAMQQVKIRNGESVVLSGFTIDDAVISKRSPIKSKAWWFGGSKNEERSKSSVVIVVTPQIRY